MLLTYLIILFIVALYSLFNLLRVTLDNFHQNILYLVEMIGFEPTTYGLQSHRSPTEPHPHVLKNLNGGPRGIRTSDLAVISRVL